MAKYDNTKFYWLQLKEDFFDEDAIDWLEEQPNGKEYSLFYLKLCLKSLRTNGILIRKVGNMLIPYDHVKLGELTKTSPDTVMVAMNLLIQIGLVQKLQNGELYMTQVEHMIGSQSKGAFKKQQQRLRGKNVLELEEGQKEDKCPPEIEKELELEQEEELEKEKEIEQEETPKRICIKKNDGSGYIICEDIKEMFDLFWNAYPKKINKKGALNSFKKIKHLDKELSLILDAIERLKQSNDWIKNNGQFIPYPATFLNQERWKDEVATVTVDDPFDLI